MKESELKKKLSQVEGKLKRSKLIEKCIQVVRVHAPNYRVHEARYHTHATGNYKGEDISIDYSDGETDFGGGHLHVAYRNERVLDAKASSGKKEPLTIEVYGFTIEAYKSGQWEKIITDLSRKNLEEKSLEQKPVDKVLDSETLEDYKKRFNF